MPGKRACPVWREAARKRPGFIQHEHGTSLGSPPYSPWTAGSGSPRTGAHLAWRVKNGAKSVPFKTLRTLPDGSELVMLHESDGMRASRRRENGRPAAPSGSRTPSPGWSPSPSPPATRSGRVKTTLDAGADHPAGPRGIPGPRDRRPVCRKMADRNRVPPLEEDRPRSPAAPLRGQSPDLPARKPGHCCSSTTSPPPHPPAPPDPPASTPASSRSPPCSASSAPTSLPRPPAGTAGTAPPARWPA